MSDIAVTVRPPDEAELHHEADAALRSAQALAITTATDYTQAAEQLKGIKSRARELDDMRKAITRPLDEAKRKVMDLFRVPLERLGEAESQIKYALTHYDRGQERRRREEEERLRAEQQREAERLRARAAKEEEKAREAARKKREREEAEAAKLEAAGRAEEAERRRLAAEESAREREAEAARKAEQLRSQADTMPPVTVLPDERTKVAGITRRAVWQYEIVDAAQLPREYLMPDEKRIRRVVQALGGDAAIPGVRVYQAEQLAAGRG